MKVGELFATLKLDSKGFDDGLDKSKRSFDGMQRAVGAGVKAFATAFAASTTAVAGLGVAALKVGVSYNSLRQTATSALTTLLGSAEAAADQMDRLDDFGKDSWVMRDVLVQAQTQMLGFGVETEKVIPYLDALQEGVAAVGGSNQDFAELAFIMAQIEGQSKITSEELRMFGRRGIDAAELIGAGMGKTAEQIRSEITAGTLDATDALDAMAASMSEEFAGATENVLKTWDGATSFIAGAWRDLGAELAKPLVDPEGGGYAVDWAMDFSDALYALRDQAGPFVDLMAKRFTPALEAVSPAIQKVVSGIKDWDVSRLNSQLDEMGKYAPLIAGTSAALFAMGSTSLPLIGRFVPAINPLVAGLGAMVAFSPELRAMGGDFFQALSPLVPVAKDLGMALADTLMDALHRLTPAMRDVLERAADLAVTFGLSLGPAIVDLLGAALPLVGVVADVVSWISQLPTPVLLTVAAFAALQGPLKPLTKLIEGVGLSLLQFGQKSAIHAALGDTNKAMGAMSVAMNGVRTAVRNVGTALKTAFISNAPLLAITAITTAIGAFATAQAEAKQRTEEYKQSLDEFGNVTSDTMDRINEALSRDRRNWVEELFGSDINSLIDDADRFGVAVEDMIGYILGEEDAIKRVTAAMDDYSVAYIEANEHFRGWRRAKGDADHVTRQFIGSLDEEANSLTDAQKEAEKKRRADEAAGIAQREATEQSETYTESLKRQIDALDEQYDKQRRASGAVLSASDATIRYNETVERATKTIKDNGENLDLNTKKGRENQSALNDLARAGLDNVDAMRQNNATGDELRSTMSKLRSDFIENAKRAGANADEAERLADELGLIPKSVKTKIEVETQSALNRVSTLASKLSGLSGTVRVGTQVINQGMFADGGMITKRADGGFDQAGRRVPRVPQMVMGGRNILWGEPETGWESYISGKPSARQRNFEVMDKTARKLGGFFIRPMANGGALGAAASSARGVPAVVEPVGLSKKEQYEALYQGARDGIVAGFSGGRSDVARFARMGV